MGRRKTDEKGKGEEEEERRGGGRGKRRRKRGESKRGGRDNKAPLGTECDSRG